MLCILIICFNKYNHIMVIIWNYKQYQYIKIEALFIKVGSATCFQYQQGESDYFYECLFGLVCWLFIMKKKNKSFVWKLENITWTANDDNKLLTPELKLFWALPNEPSPLAFTSFTRQGRAGSPVWVCSLYFLYIICLKERGIRK